MKGGDVGLELEWVMCAAREEIYVIRGERHRLRGRYTHLAYARAIMKG
jgi:hypothetical protein